MCGASASPAAHARASRYQAQLVEHITANPSFIQPEARRNDILQRLQREPLLDLSISRTTFDWGIPLPDDPKHVMCAARWAPRWRRTSSPRIRARRRWMPQRCGSTCRRWARRRRHQGRRGRQRWLHPSCCSRCWPCRHEHCIIYELYGRQSNRLTPRARSISNASRSVSNPTL